jgi:hypothetical protein
MIPDPAPAEGPGQPAPPEWEGWDDERLLDGSAYGAASWSRSSAR